MKKKSLPLKIAILGFGGRAEGLAKQTQLDPALRSAIRVVCVVDPRPERRQLAADLFGVDCRLLESGEAFYNQRLDVDGIWVISKENTHAELAVPALERGIPLIVEKPLATSIRDAYRICEAYDRKPVPLVVPHSLRYLASYRKAKEIVDSGVLGRILHIHADEQIDDQHTVGGYRRGPCMYRSDTAFLLAKCSHDIDIINWMMGGVRARSVACFGGADYFKRRPELPDVCSDACPEAMRCPFKLTSGSLGETFSEFVRSWKVSRLLPPGDIASAPPVRLSDPLDWKDVRSSPATPWFVSGAFRASGRDGLLYFGNTFQVEEAGDYILHLGHDGGARIFVDGQPVATQPKRQNPCTQDRTQARVALTRGPHDIMIAFDVDEAKGEGICFSFESPGERRPVFPVQWSDRAETVAIDKDTSVMVRGRRCAWNSGGEQVDHQTLILQYENGTTADFTLDCFSGTGRHLQITGSDGFVYATPTSLKLVLHHPHRVEEFGPDQLPAQSGSHGGGDAALLKDWVQAVMSGGKTGSASVHESAEAVAVCVGAEVSMLRHRIVEMAELRQERPGPEVLLGSFERGGVA